jgi:ferric-dicitrate binding protein FerR (iron transport regulator)
VAGECSDREKAEVHALIAVNHEKARLLDELRSIADAAKASNTHLDAAKAWQSLDQRLQQGARITSLARSRDIGRRRAAGPRSLADDGVVTHTDPRTNYNSDHRAVRRARLRHSVLLAAAVFAAVIVGTFIAVDLSVAPKLAEQQPDFQVFATTKGERATVQLADGTRVLLNADSRLTVPADFLQDVRLVQFEGQGYFDVAASNDLPFVVKTQLADVRVLGTEFDIDAHPDAPEMQVVVATGEVSVRSNHGDEKESIILRPRDLGIVLQAGGQLVRRNIDVDRYFAWREGRLVFENASFQEVSAMLERWYDLSVRLERPSENVDGLTATFRDESVDEVLTVISAALSLQYQKDGKNITFYPAP